MIFYYDSNAVKQNLQNYKPSSDFSLPNSWWAATGDFMPEGLSIHEDGVEEPGIYPIGFYGWIDFWMGMIKDDPNWHEPDSFLNAMDPVVLQHVRDGKLRIVIFSGVEGNDPTAGIKKLNNSMVNFKLPEKSIIVAYGDLRDYNPLMFDMVDHAGCFQNCAWLAALQYRKKPIYISKNAKAYNSLNRVWKPHRAAHLYQLAKDDILKDGVVSCAYLHHLGPAMMLLPEAKEDMVDVMSLNYPKHIDGDHSTTNQATNLNLDVYENSQLSVVTESLYEGEIFFSEKTWKPIYVGHPFMIIGSKGHLQKLREYGYRTDFSGIDDSYDEIEDTSDRLRAIHKILKGWCALSPEERRAHLAKSEEAIVHNMIHYRETNHYQNTVNDIIENTKNYFDNFGKNSSF